MKYLKSVVYFILSIVIAMSSLVTAVPASASSTVGTISGPSLASWAPAVTKVTTANVPVYRYATGKTRGTCTPAVSHKAVIPQNAIVEVIGYSSGRWLIRYQTTSGVREGWVDVTYITPSGAGAIKKFVAKATTNTVYADGSYAGCISLGDTVYYYGKKNSYYCVEYTTPSGFKIACITPAQYNLILNGLSLTSPVPSGCKFSSKTSDSGVVIYHDINRNVSTSTPVYAIADGTVTCKQVYRVINGTRYLTSYGNYVQFTSKDGTYTAKYCHLSRFSAGINQVIPSSNTKQLSGSDGTITITTKTVKKGDIIGYIGTTGNSTGVHLHFELYKNGTRVDPTTVFPSLK